LIFAALIFGCQFYLILHSSAAKKENISLKLT